jgi:hypothetical protein
MGKGRKRVRCCRTSSLAKEARRSSYSNFVENSSTLIRCPTGDGNGANGPFCAIFFVTNLPRMTLFCAQSFLTKSNVRSQKKQDAPFPHCRSARSLWEPFSRHIKNFRLRKRFPLPTNYLRPNPSSVSRPDRTCDPLPPLGPAQIPHSF